MMFFKIKYPQIQLLIIFININTICFHALIYIDSKEMLFLFTIKSRINIKPAKRANSLNILFG